MRHTDSTRPEVVVRFGCRVLELRLISGATQSEFAAKFGHDRSYISDLERGRKGASLPLMQELADFYGLSLAQLFEGV